MPHNCLTEEQRIHLEGVLDMWYHAQDKAALQTLQSAGFMYPTAPPNVWDTLQAEWDELMDSKNITALSNTELENYLEKWLRLLGYGYWVQGVWQDRYSTIEKCAEYIKDYIFAYASGGREQKAAVAGSHPIYMHAMEAKIEAERKLTNLSALIRKWEKIEFTISRTITNRQNGSFRS